MTIEPNENVAMGTRRKKRERPLFLLVHAPSDGRTGGVQTRVDNYVKHLPSFGYDVEPIERPARAGFVGKTRFVARVLAKNPDIVHVHEGAFSFEGFALFALRKIFGKPTGIALYGGEAMDARNEISKRRRRVLKAYERWASPLMVNSNATRNMFEPGVRDRLKIVTPGVRDDLLEEAGRDIGRRETGGPFRILFLGRLIRRKGVDDVIAAMGILKREGILATLDIVGGVGSSGSGIRETLEDLAKRSNASDVVRFLGEERSKEGVANLLRGTDLLVMPPKHVENGGFESFGCVYLEANAFGKPVVGTRHGGVSEAIEDGVTGILVEEANPEQLAEAIREIIEDPDLAKRLGAAGKRRVRKAFTAKHSARQLAEAYAAD